MVNKLISLEKEMLDKLTKLAKEEERDVNSMIRYIIKQYLK